MLGYCGCYVTSYHVLVFISLKLSCGEHIQFRYAVLSQQEEHPHSFRVTSCIISPSHIQPYRCIYLIYGGTSNNKSQVHDKQMLPFSL